MNAEKYLERIGLDSASFAQTLETLKTLQKAHLLTVPFENLDFHWGKRITLDLDRFYKKIVENGRGGFCYELNGNFNELLRAIGFETKIVSAWVANKEGEFGEEYDHLAIVVVINGKEYLCDVGFGDFIAEPLRLELEIEQSDPNGVYRMSIFESGYLVEKKNSADWSSEYTFKNLKRGLDEFSEMCVYNQTSPESHFTHGKLCSVMTETGRKTLTDKKFIVTENDKRHEKDIRSDEDFNDVLQREFGIAQKDSLPNG